MSVTADHICQYVAGNQMKAELEVITSLGSGTDSQIPTAAAVDSAISGVSHNPVTIAAGSAAAMSIDGSQEITVDAGLVSIAGLTTAADKMIYTTALDTYAVADLTAFARTILDDADAATVRGTIGLGSIATQAANSVAITGGSITGITNLAIADGGTGAGTASDARTNLAAVGYSGSLTSGRVPYLAASQILADSANLTFDGTTLTAHTLTIGTGKLTMPAAAEIEAATSLDLDAPFVGIDGATQQSSEKFGVLGDAYLAGDLELTNTTFASQNGVIEKGGSRFIHDFSYGNNGTVTTDGGNVFVGEEAGNLTMGSTATSAYEASYNIAMGYRTLFSNTTGYRNAAVGHQTLYGNTTGYRNAAIGGDALYSNLAGYRNSAVGYRALYSNLAGYDNAAVGYRALYGNTTGYRNAAIGSDALYGNTTGYRNAAIGGDAGRYITGGAVANETSNTSIYLGEDTKAAADGDTNEIVIGYNATGAGSNTVTLGNDSIVTTLLKGNVLIGATAQYASETLGVNGAGYFNGDVEVASGSGYKVNGTQVVGAQQTALTAQLTTITHTAPGTPDYAIQDLTNSSPYGFASQDEGNTVLSVIANLQTRVAQLETKLQTHGLIA